MSNQTSRNTGSGTPDASRRPSTNGLPAKKAVVSTTSKGAPAAKGASQAPRASVGSRGTAPPPRPAAKPGQVRVAPSRVSRPLAQPKKAFRIRPMDLGLIAVGVIGVVVLVWVVLSSTANGAGAGSSANDDPRNRIASRQPTPLVPGQLAPDFTLPSTDGQTITLSQYHGKVVLLELMAPWCPHCQADSSLLNDVWSTYKNKDVQFLAVNATPYGKNHESGDDSLITMDDQKWFHDNFGLQYPLLFDAQVKVADDYGVVSFPTIYVLDTRGAIVAEPDNPVSAQGLSAALDNALALPKSTGALPPAGVVAQTGK